MVISDRDMANHYASSPHVCIENSNVQFSDNSALSDQKISFILKLLSSDYFVLGPTRLTIGPMWMKFLRSNVLKSKQGTNFILASKNEHL